MLGDFSIVMGRGILKAIRTFGVSLAGLFHSVWTSGDWLRSAAEVPVPLGLPTLPDERGQAPGEYTGSQSPFARPIENETALYPGCKS
jgi:hypothetical protein